VAELSIVDVPEASRYEAKFGDKLAGGAYRSRTADWSPAARPANSEGLLISLAAELEAEERWHERRPPVAF